MLHSIQSIYVILNIVTIQKGGGLQLKALHLCKTSKKPGKENRPEIFLEASITQNSQKIDEAD